MLAAPHGRSCGGTVRGRERDGNAAGRRPSDALSTEHFMGRDPTVSVSVSGPARLPRCCWGPPLKCFGRSPLKKLKKPKIKRREDPTIQPCAAAATSSSARRVECVFQDQWRSEHTRLFFMTLASFQDVLVVKGIRGTVTSGLSRRAAQRAALLLQPWLRPEHRLQL